MRKTKITVSLLLAVVMTLSCFAVTAFAVDGAYVCIGDGKYNSSVEGNGWSLSGSNGNFSLSLNDAFADSILYRDGYISAYNCTLSITVGDEAIFSAGHAEDSAPYDLYVIYAENSNVTVTGGDLTIETKQARSAIPFYLKDSTLTIQSATLTVDCFGELVKLEGNSKLDILAGTKLVIDGEEKTVTEDGEIVKKECEHIDEDEDGICDLCGYVLFEKEPVTDDADDAEKICPFCETYNEYKDTLILNFFVTFLHLIIHKFFSK